MHISFTPALAASSLLMGGLLLTGTLVGHQFGTNTRTAQERFDDDVHATVVALRGRLRSYSDVALGARGLLLANPALNYRQFAQIMHGRTLKQDYPEIRNLSFARWVRTDQLAVFEQQLAAQAAAAGHNASTPTVHPAVTGNDHYIIEFLWPEAGNAGILGLDIASQPANLAAVQRSRETGRPSASAPFDLLQENEQPEAFVLRYPVFEPAPEGSDGPTRFTGTVAITIRIKEMLDAVAASGALRNLALQLQDIGSLQDATPSQPQQMGQWRALPTEQDATALHAVDALEVHGRRWRLRFASATPLLSEAERTLPLWTGAAGVALSLLLAAVAGLLVRQRAQAALREQQAVNELHGSQRQMSAFFDQTAVGVTVTNIRTGHFMRVNRTFCELIGYDEAELLKLDVSSISHPDDPFAHRMLQERVQGGEMPVFHLEKRLLRKDGQPLWVDLTLTPIWGTDAVPTEAVTVVQDITERQQMRQALITSEQRLRAMLDHLPLGILLTANNNEIVFRNDAFMQMTGYSAQLVHDSDSWWLHAVPDPLARESAQTRWRALRAQTHNGVCGPQEFEIRHANGQWRTLMMSSVPMDGKRMILFEDVSERKATEDELSYLAYHDPLTHLANRRFLIERLNQALVRTERSGACGTLLMLDLDHFKTLNETRGHERGDLLLRAVAERLQAFVHGEETLARHGDDAFVLVLDSPDATFAEAATHAGDTCTHILAALREPFTLDGEPWHTTASIGAALFKGCNESAEHLLQQVDMAMYQAKVAGRDTVRFFDPELQARVQARTQLEHDLRTALDARQFELFYQVQVREGHIIGAEALVRWHHPEKGYVSPAQFIPLAEETGLILPLGHWVLRTACRQLAAWAQDPQLAPLTLAVNISPKQFYQSDFTNQVLTALADSGANASQLELELTEGLLLQDVEGTIAKMIQLKACGVDFSLDDFGTGYSSLSYLKRLPLDQLKIDQSFVHDVLADPNDAAIARTIVALGESLGLRVIAEGVETEAQRAFLQQHGCNTWQGYLFSKPVPLQAFEALVREGKLGAGR